MDTMKRDALGAKIHAQGNRPTGDTPLPVVTLEDFFEANDDPGSISCNWAENPGPQHFYATLRSIRDRPDVQDVLVEITEAVEDGIDWPFSDPSGYHVWPVWWD